MKINPSQLITTSANKINRFTGKTGFLIRKNSPEILLGGGIVGIVVTVVTACKATLKADEVLDHHEEKMKKIHQAEIYQDDECPYPSEVSTKEKMIAYVQTGGEFVKLYGPSIAVGSLSIACILWSNKILKTRYLTAVAAYNAVSTSYRQYRERVRERYGDNVDYEMRYGVTREQIEIKDGNGKPTKKKETVEVINNNPSEYARYWGKYLKDGIINPNWDENPEFNLLFLNAKCEEAEHTLHARGYIFLNEVYDLLGFEHSQLGQLVGWVDDGTHDGYIDFGIYTLNNPTNKRFINGDENALILDFNCDGFIWDKI